MTTIDHSRFFVPEALTPLFHTGKYAGLTADQRRRYNQLHGMYVNEQILFFEVTLADNILGALLCEPLPVPLAAGLLTFVEDETAHARMFRELNRRCAPDVYGARDFSFVRIPALAGRALRFASQRPTVFPLFIWLMLMLEERALHYAREIQRHRATLDSEFVETHARHLRDEARHVRWDQQILDWFWPRTSRGLRTVNAMLFRWMVGEFFNLPRRASLRVVRELVREFPDLAPRLGELEGDLRALGRCQDYHQSLYSRRIVPRTFARFDDSPEFASVGRVLRGYRRAELSAP